MKIFSYFKLLLLCALVLSGPTQTNALHVDFNGAGREMGKVVRTITGFFGKVRGAVNSVGAALRNVFNASGIVNTVKQRLTAIPRAIGSVKHAFSQLKSVPGSIANLARRVFNEIKKLPNLIKKGLQFLFLEFPKKIAKKYFGGGGMSSLKSMGSCRVITCIADAIVHRATKGGHKVPILPTPHVMKNACMMFSWTLGPDGVEVICKISGLIKGHRRLLEEGKSQRNRKTFVEEVVEQESRELATCKITQPAYPKGPFYTAFSLVSRLAKGNASTRTDAELYATFRHGHNLIAFFTALLAKPVEKDSVMYVSTGATLIIEFIMKLLDEIVGRLIDMMEVNDGLIDGAEIQAAHLNSEHLVGRMCVAKSKVAALAGGKRLLLSDGGFEENTDEVKKMVSQRNESAAAQFETFDSRSGAIDSKISNAKGRLEGIDEKLSVVNGQLTMIAALLAK